MPRLSQEDRYELKLLERRRRAHRAGAVVGIDAGKYKHCLVVRPQDERDSKPLMFPVTREGFDQAEDFILRQAGGIVPEQILIGIELAGIYGQTAAHFFHTRGFKVVAVPPANTKAFKRVVHGKRIKTDKKDAKSITALVADGHFHEFPYLKPVYAELRHLTSARERLTKPPERRGDAGQEQSGDPLARVRIGLP